MVRVAGTEQLISPGATWVYGYDPSTGRELWREGYGLNGFSVVPRPVHRDGTVYVCTGYGKAHLLALQLAGTSAGKGRYSVNNGFSEEIELSIRSADGVVGSKSASGGAETAGVTHSKRQAQVVLGFVVQAASP